MKNIIIFVIIVIVTLIILVIIMNNDNKKMNVGTNIIYEQESSKCDSINCGDIKNSNSCDDFPISKGCCHWLTCPVSYGHSGCFPKYKLCQ